MNLHRSDRFCNEKILLRVCTAKFLFLAKQQKKRIKFKGGKATFNRCKNVETSHKHKKKTLYCGCSIFDCGFLCLIILRSVSLSFSHNIFDKQCEGLRVWMCDGNINNPSDLQTETFFQTFKRKFLLQAYLFYFSEDIFIHDLLIK